MEFKPMTEEEIKWPTIEELQQQDDTFWVKIKPVHISIFQKKESVLLGIKPIGGKLNSHHSFNYCFVAEDMEVQYADTLTISAEDYKKWGEDDMYPVHCIVNAVPALELLEEAEKQEEVN